MTAVRSDAERQGARMPNAAAPNDILEVEDLKLYFPIYAGFIRKVVGHVKAVDGVSLHLREREVLGLVGESGCGKTTLGRTILRLYDPTSGEIRFRRQTGEWVDIARISQHDMKPLRREMRMIFQDPFSSLNPRLTVKDIIGEPLEIHNIAHGKEQEQRVAELMQAVGLNPALMRRYPHEFSGGQRQRIGLARTLSLNPRLIVADEPVSALDVSVQAQVLNLLEELKERLGLTLIFVGHDLSVVEHISDRIAVMYVGKIVEMAETNELLHHPLHPYTEALLSAIPPADPDIHPNRIRLQGEVASPANPPPGLQLSPTLQLCPGDLQPASASLDRGCAGALCQLPFRERTAPQRNRRTSVIGLPTTSTSSRFAGAFAYVPVIGWLYVLLLQRRNPFALFHLRQSIGLVLSLIAVTVGWTVVTWILAWIPYAFVFGIAMFALVIAAYFFGVVLSLMGVRNALNSTSIPLPLFGAWASRLPIR